MHNVFLAGSIDAINIVLKHNPDLNDKDPDGDTVLIQSAGYNEIENVKILLKTNVDVNIRSDDGGDTALIRAIKNGSKDIIKILIKYKKQI